MTSMGFSRVVAFDATTSASRGVPSASARVADHIDRLGGLVDALWNPQLEKLRAKIASATVVDRRRPS